MTGPHRGGSDAALQDRLRALDADVASGVLSAQEYRRRRDELLVSASDRSAPDRSAPDRADAGAGDDGAAVSAPTAGPGGEVHPFPPPFRWGAAGAPGGASRTADTQVIDASRVAAAAMARNSTERTQVISRAVVDRAGRGGTGPGLPPWWTSAAATRAQESPRAGTAADVFDESPPPPYRVATAAVLIVAVMALAIVLFLV